MFQVLFCLCSFRTSVFTWQQDCVPVSIQNTVSKDCFKNTVYGIQYIFCVSSPEILNWTTCCLTQRVTWRSPTLDYVKKVETFTPFHGFFFNLIFLLMCLVTLIALGMKSGTFVRHFRLSQVWVLGTGPVRSVGLQSFWLRRF